jgi:hypothetical protein
MVRGSAVVMTLTEPLSFSGSELDFGGKAGAD